MPSPLHHLHSFPCKVNWQHKPLCVPGSKPDPESGCLDLEKKESPEDSFLYQGRLPGEGGYRTKSEKHQGREIPDKRHSGNKCCLTGQGGDQAGLSSVQRSQRR